MINVNTIFYYKHQLVISHYNRNQIKLSIGDNVTHKQNNTQKS